MRGVGFIKSFLPHRMKRQVKELFVATIMVNLALAMVQIFEPIYLYSIGYKLQDIMLFYLITYVLYIAIIPLGGKFSKLKGYELSIFIGSILFIAYYVGLYYIADYPWLFYVVPVILAIQKSFYWPAYHANFASFSDDDEEGREISSMNVASSLVFILGPAIAGFIIMEWGYEALFIMASILFLTSNIATLSTKEKFEPHYYSYRQSFKRLFAKKNRKEFLAYTGFGEELVVLVVWPVYISLIITDIFDLGLMMALTTFITTAITMYIGKLSDVIDKKKILNFGSIFYAIAWLARLFVNNIKGVFVVDTMSRLGKNTIVVPLTAITYERAKDKVFNKKRKIMEKILFFEMGLVIGKLVALIIIYAALFFVPNEILAFKMTFLLAAGMSLLYMLL